MIDREHDLPIKRQAEVLRISRGTAYYKPRPVSANDLLLMRQIDELHLNYLRLNGTAFDSVQPSEGFQEKVGVKLEQVV